MLAMILRVCLGPTSDLPRGEERSRNMELSYLIGDGIQVSGAFCKGGWVQDVLELSI